MNCFIGDEVSYKATEVCFMTSDCRAISYVMKKDSHYLAAF